MQCYFGVPLTANTKIKYLLSRKIPSELLQKLSLSIYIYNAHISQMC